MNRIYYSVYKFAGILSSELFCKLYCLIDYNFDWYIGKTAHFGYGEPEDITVNGRHPFKFPVGCFFTNQFINMF